MHARGGRAKRPSSAHALQCAAQGRRGPAPPLDVRWPAVLAADIWQDGTMADGSKTRTQEGAQWSQATAAGYMPGFGNDFETEALPGALPVGQNSPQRPPTASTPSSCPARRSQRRAAAMSDRGSIASARRSSTRQSSSGRRCPSGRRHRQRPSTTAPSVSCAGDRCPSQREGHLPDGSAHHDHRRRRQHPGRHGGARLSHHPVDAKRVLLQCRWRNADCAAARRGSASSPSSAASRSSPEKSASFRAA